MNFWVNLLAASAFAYTYSWREMARAFIKIPETLPLRFKLAPAIWTSQATIPTRSRGASKVSTPKETVPQH